MILLQTQQLTLAAGPRLLVEGLDLAVAAGQNWAVLGPNGAGKSTLVRALAGLVKPQAGRVQILDRAIEDVGGRERARFLGVLLQEDEVVFPAPVFDTVLIGRHPHLGRWQWESATDRAIARDALGAVEMTSFMPRDITALSGGERRRVSIATVLAQDPRLGLWDEPLNHLDPRHQSLVLSHLATRAGRPGHAGMFVLHDVNLAVRHCSHALMLFGDGRAMSGPIAELMEAPRLSELYQAPMRAFRDAERVWFVMD